MADDGAPADAYRGRTVCVTGGAGFIGSHLTAALVAGGADVRVLDDLSSGDPANVEAVADRIRFVRGSILDPVALETAVGGASVVFHLAALASVPRSMAEPVLYTEVNVTGTMRVLETARAGGAARVVFAASSSAYGDQPGQPRVETMPPDPRSPYAASKCAAEMLVRAYAASYPLDGVSLRYFNIFGPRQAPDSAYAAVVPRFARALLGGERPVVYGDGHQTRDFTPVANAVHANLLAGAAPDRLDGAVVNVGAGDTRSVLDILGAMAALAGRPADCDFEPARPGDVRHSAADITRARTLLGYESRITFDAALAETMEYYEGRFAGSS